MWSWGSGRLCGGVAACCYWSTITEVWLYLQRSEEQLYLWRSRRLPLWSMAKIQVEGLSVRGAWKSGYFHGWRARFGCIASTGVRPPLAFHSNMSSRLQFADTLHVLCGFLPIDEVGCFVELLQAILFSGFEFCGSFRAARNWFRSQLEGVCFNFVGKGWVCCFSNYAAFEALVSVDWLKTWSMEKTWQTWKLFCAFLWGVWHRFIDEFIGGTTFLCVYWSWSVFLEQLHVWVWNTQGALHSKTSARLSVWMQAFKHALKHYFSSGTKSLEHGSLLVLA